MTAARQVIEWDKDDVDALRMMKMDCLALGMLSCMKRAFDLLSEHKSVNLDLATIENVTASVCPDIATARDVNAADGLPS